MLAIVLNGDWRNRHEIQHQCGRNCCADWEASVEKVVSTIIRLLRAVRPGSKLCQGNWLEWIRPLYFIGLLQSVHGILLDGYTSAFCGVSQREARFPFLGRVKAYAAHRKRCKSFELWMKGSHVIRLEKGECEGLYSVPHTRS